MDSATLENVENSVFWPENPFPIILSYLPILLLLSAGAQTFAFVKYLKERKVSNRMNSLELVKMNAVAPLLTAIALMILYLAVMTFSSLTGLEMQTFVYVKILVTFVVSLYPSLVLKSVDQLHKTAISLTVQTILLIPCHTLASYRLSTVYALLPSFISHETTRFVTALIIHFLFRLAAPWIVGTLIALTICGMLTVVAKMLKQSSIT